MSEEKELATVAMHEAGHVVVSHYFLRKVYGAKIGEHQSRSDRSVVRFEVTPHVEDLHLRMHELDELWPLAVRETIVTTKIRFAGPISQAIYLKKPFRDVHGGQDYRDAIMELLLLERRRLSFPNADRLDISYKDQDVLDIVVRDIVNLLVDREYINYVGLVARGLIEHQELNAEQIREILEDMPVHDWGAV
jgi:hypothetical protein